MSERIRMQQKMTLASTPNTMVTRCPKCSTAFRITAAQLESAKGAVRCGSCLHVFKAQSHLVTKPATAPTPQTNKPASPISSLAKTIATPKTEIEKPKTESEKPKKQVVKPEAAKSSTKPVVKKTLTKLHDEDDVLISDDMEDQASGKSRYEFDGFLDMDLETKVQASSLFDRKIKDESEKVIKDNADESWAENLMDDDDDDIPQIGIIKTQTSTTPVKSHEKQEREEREERENELAFSFIDEVKPSHLDNSDGFAHSNDYELSEELSRIPNAKPKQSVAEEKEEIINAIPVAGIFHDEDFEESANKRQLKIEPKIRSYDGSRSGLLKNIIPAPLEFTANNISYWYHRILWPLLAVIALIGIILQLAYFRFDHYARIQPYRDFYAFACPVVGCTLPTLVDKKQIVTYNLVVQAHSEVEDALLVDVMLLNKAGFEQPFPDLLLSFSDMDDVVKASRRFTPEDYLGGELAGKKLIPIKQPIHITLEIKDPKVDNYKMDVL